MTARAALGISVLLLVLGCASRQSELEFQELGSRDPIPRRWHRATEATAAAMARGLPGVAPGRVTVVEFEDRTPLLDVDVELLREHAVAALRRAGYEVEEDDVDALRDVAGDVALVGSVVETRNPAAPTEVCVDLTTALMQLEPTGWTRRAVGFKRWRIVVAVAPPPPPRPRR